MRRIYHKVRARTIETVVDIRGHIVPLVGFTTFFFGFGAGAILNLYLNAVNHPLVSQFRSALTYKSAIIGDGIILPVIGMVAASFLLREREFVTKNVVQGSLVSAGVITAWFHITQALDKIVNWAMPTPWHWNFLGLWHAIYMFSMATLFSLFAIILVKVIREERELPKEGIIVALGVLAFFALLKLDYMAVKIF
ncbi:hypothetical protein HYZ78_00085 [Candidatus Microgenomates bacterium]|nr:hypothetical protein [Candidatus Microgenomates bacterium]